MEGFSGTPTFVRRDLYIDTENIKGAKERYERPLIVLQVQEGAEPLNLVANYIESNLIYTSESDTFIAENEQLFYFRNDPGSKESRKSIPASDDTFLRISFDYGKGKGDIDETQYAKDFKLIPYNTFDNNYKINAPKDTKNLYWELISADNIFLQKTPNDRLALKFQNLSAHVPGIATLHIEYFNVPGRRDGYCSLDLIKAAPDFSIINFNAKKVYLGKDQKAALNWKVVSARYATLQFKKYDENQTLSTDVDHVRLGRKFEEREKNYSMELNQSKDFEIDIYEDTYFTLSAYGERFIAEAGADRDNQEPYIRDQRQLYVSIVPSLRQYALQCFYAGDDAELAVIKCVRKFDLEILDDDELKLCDDKIKELVKNLKSAGFQPDDLIYSATDKYYYNKGENENWTKNRDHFKDIMEKALQ